MASVFSRVVGSNRGAEVDDLWAEVGHFCFEATSEIPPLNVREFGTRPLAFARFSNGRALYRTED